MIARCGICNNGLTIRGREPVLLLHQDGLHYTLQCLPCVTELATQKRRPRFPTVMAVADAGRETARNLWRDLRGGKTGI